MDEPVQDRAGGAVEQALGDARGSLLVRRDNGVVTLELHRPERRNAVTFAMWSALARVLPVLAADENVAVLVLRGSPGGPFSAGADISEFGALRATLAQAQAYGEAVTGGERALLDFPRPTLALVQGHAVGGGTQLAAACDLRLCDEGALFGVTPARLGIVYALPSTARLVDVVGQSWAAWLLLTGELVDAATAARAGLVHEVCPADALEERAYGLARLLGRRARVSQTGAKALLARVAAGQREDDAAVEQLHVDALCSPEYAEGVAAFLGKREPRFAAVRRPT